MAETENARKLGVRRRRDVARENRRRGDDPRGWEGRAGGRGVELRPLHHAVPQARHEDAPRRQVLALRPAAVRTRHEEDSRGGRDGREPPPQHGLEPVHQLSLQRRQRPASQEGREGRARGGAEAEGLLHDARADAEPAGVLRAQVARRRGAPEARRVRAGLAHHEQGRSASLAARARGARHPPRVARERALPAGVSAPSRPRRDHHARHALGQLLPRGPRLSRARIRHRRALHRRHGAHGRVHAARAAHPRPRRDAPPRGQPQLEPPQSPCRKRQHEPRVHRPLSVFRPALARRGFPQQHAVRLLADRALRHRVRHRGRNARKGQSVPGAALRHDRPVGMGRQSAGPLEVLRRGEARQHGACRLVG